LPEDPSQPSLFTQVGEAAVALVVEKFYRLILADPALAPAFDGVDMDHLKKHQKAFVVFALGGPDHYTGRTLRVVHQRFHGVVGDKEFDMVLAHLGAALSLLNVPANVRAAVLEKVDTTRADVLGR